MTNQSTVAQQVAEEFFGDATLLAERLGSAEGLLALPGAAGSTQFQRVTDLRSLRRFLSDYQTQVLVPLELPVIHRSCRHASRYEVRELIELDQRLAAQPLLQEFATASRRVGKAQLKRLRPLRDQRLVQRYLGAVEAGEAHAWHTVVYGVALSIYSLPLRQGLLSYARQTTRGFIDSAARQRKFAEEDCRKLMEECCAGFPAAIDGVLSATEPGLITG
jgi:urease accessory protein UreF